MSHSVVDLYLFMHIPYIYEPSRAIHMNFFLITDVSIPHFLLINGFMILQIQLFLFFIFQSEITIPLFTSRKVDVPVILVVAMLVFRRVQNYYTTEF